MGGFESPGRKEIVTGALINNVPRSMLEALRDYAEQEALEHRTLMASYRPERQAYLDAQLAKLMQSWRLLARLQIPTTQQPKAKPLLKT
jgi:hypothetical protein